MCKSSLQRIKSYSLVSIAFMFISLSASASWYECRTEKNDSKFSFEPTTSRHLHIYSPLHVESLNKTFEGAFVMSTNDEKNFFTDISEAFDYPCNYQGAELQLSLSNDKANISIEVKCDGASPFKIYADQAACVAY